MYIDSPDCHLCHNVLLHCYIAYVCLSDLMPTLSLHLSQEYQFNQDSYYSCSMFVSLWFKQLVFMLSFVPYLFEFVRLYYYVN